MGNVRFKKKKVGKSMDVNDKGNKEIKLVIPLNLDHVDLDISKSDTVDIDMLLANSTCSLEKWFLWVISEILVIKQWINDIINSLNETLMLDKTNKLL